MDKNSVKTDFASLTKINNMAKSLNWAMICCKCKADAQGNLTLEATRVNLSVSN